MHIQCLQFSSLHTQKFKCACSFVLRVPTANEWTGCSAPNRVNSEKGESNIEFTSNVNVCRNGAHCLLLNFIMCASDSPLNWKGLLFGDYHTKPIELGCCTEFRMNTFIQPTMNFVRVFSCREFFGEDESVFIFYFDFKFRGNIFKYKLMAYDTIKSTALALGTEHWKYL